jgi:hypothetical protein
MNYLPGESITLLLSGKGNDNTQAVGHLDDGTMVVVEQAKAKIGQIVTAEVIRNLQTAAGRMVFARLITKQDQTSQVSTKKQPAPAARSTPRQHADAPAPSQNVAKKSRVSRNEPAQKKPSAPNQNQKSRAVSRSNKASSKEALLIELVNKQQD